MRSKKETLPEGFRIQSYCVVSGAVDDPYDWGEWSYRLQKWDTWTEGIWWWKHQVTGWRTVERNSDYGLLVQTANLINKGKK